MSLLDRITNFFGFGREVKQENIADNNVIEREFIAPSMGRASVSQHDDNMQVDMGFARQYYKDLNRIADTNPYVSYALSNYNMANMPHQIYLPETYSQRKQKDMHKHLTSVRDRWFDGGIASLDSAMTRELMVTGAISIEAIIDSAKKGVYKVDEVPMDSLYFFREGNDFVPYQMPTTGMFNKNLKYESHKGIKLLDNYIYVPVQRKLSSPYPIPPFLASIFTVKQHEELMKSMYGLAKRLGVGFVSVMVDADAGKEKANAGISNDIAKSNAYKKREESRVRTLIETAYDRIKNGLTNGVFVGLKGQHEIKVEGEMNADNSQKMLNVFNDLLFAALKQDPNFMGQNRASTETFGNVILKKFTEQIEHILFAKGTVYKKLYQIELLYAGFGWVDLKVEFDTLSLTDPKKNEEARKLKIDSLLALLDKQLISRQQVANELGYDEPYMSDADFDKLRQKAAEPTEATNNQNLDTESIDFDSLINPVSYDYYVPIECSSTDKESFAVPVSDFKNKQMNKFAKRYIKALNKQYGVYVDNAKKVITKELKATKKLSLAKFQSILIGAAIEEFDKSFAKKNNSTIKTNIYDTYSYFRSDKSIFRKRKATTKNSILIEEHTETFNVPDSTFEQIDLQTIRYLQSSDSLYLGRFITDEDTINRFRNRIAELYVEYGAVDLGSDSEALAALVEEFAVSLGLEAWKIRRIAETTLNNARSYSSIRYMNQLEIEKYKRVEIADNVICPHCLSINGTEFTVRSAVDTIGTIVSTDVETVPAFAVTRPLDEFRNMTPVQMQDAGIGFGSLHPHCRGMNLPIM